MAAWHTVRPTHRTRAQVAQLLRALDVHLLRCGDLHSFAEANGIQWSQGWVQALARRIGWRYFCATAGERAEVVARRRVDGYQPLPRRHCGFDSKSCRAPEDDLDRRVNAHYLVELPPKALAMDLGIPVITIAGRARRLGWRCVYITGREAALLRAGRHRGQIHQGKAA